MADFALNPDLASSYQVPGVYAYSSKAGAAPSALNRRVLLLGYKTSAGTAQAGSLKRLLSEDDAVRWAGKGSSIHRMFRDFTSQPESAAGEVWAMLLNAPSGTAQTRKITVIAAPSGAVLDGSSTTAAAPGIWTLWICGKRFDCQIALGDSYATIAANMTAQIVAGQDELPCTAGVASATITLTSRHAALSSADLPVMSAFSTEGMALAASCGTLTFASAATGAGSVSLAVSTLTAATAIANTDTANAINAALIAAINNTSAFSVRAAQPSTPGAVATLVLNDNCEINWLATSITSGIATTLTVDCGASAAGLPSSATPSLSTVLTTLSSEEPFGQIVTDLTGAGSYVTAAGTTQTGSATDYSVLGSLSSWIELRGNGLNCAGQRLLFADTRSLALAGAVPVGTSPQLTQSPRYFAETIPGSPCQAVASAARCAAIVVGNLDYPSFNYAGAQIRTDGRVPYLAPRREIRLSDSDCNAAMLSYFLTPLRVGSSGNVEIVSGRTTAKPSASVDFRYSFWSVMLADDYMRDDLRATIAGVILGKTLKTAAPPRTARAISPDSINTAVASRIEKYDSLDIFDGSDDLVTAIESGVKVSPQRIDVKVPKRFAIPAEQVSIYTALAS